jgi:hypothetical protein
MNKLVQFAVLPAILCAVAQVSVAGDVGQHPAVFVPRSLPGIEASTFIPGHPAGGYAGHAAHANFEHPAVVMHRAAQVGHIDPNTFIVQPPAATAWTTPVAAPIVTAAITVN